MKLSIIVAVYDAEATLRRCLDSCLNQTYRDFEVIIVDDGSKDGSLKIIEEYCRRYPKLFKSFPLEVNSGSGKACNIGLSHVSGDYFTFLDDDDVVVPDGYAQIMAAAEASKADILMFDAYQVAPDGSRRRYYSALDFSNEGEISRQQYFIALPFPWNKIYKRKFIDLGMRFPEGIWYAYLACIPALAGAADKIVYLKKPLIEYYQTENSMTRNDKFRVKSLDILKAITILNQNSNQSLFKMECEFLAYQYILKIGAPFLNEYRQDQYLDELANYMAKYFPRWQQNMYVKKERSEDVRRANLYFKKKYKVIRMRDKISALLHRKNHN
ncbi:glycosyltransferase family 2 protein [Dielma fastidiosa]|uniref:glycosyltransferase family 2 protein n=1 Tax=Dielma fastidiosa TaxID=1034346 RepID=UPI0023F1E3A9|nr:glycosyltransferase family 2 protein [Dielma fastidiosa]